MKATLSLTHCCNLGCNYCYSGESYNKHMPFDTAMRVVDFIFSLNSQEQEVSFCFFGGEPFLCFDLMRKITEYIRKESTRLGKKANLSVTTNGTIFNTSILKFLNEENFDLCFSMDGPAYIHDLNRVFKNGQGSHKIVVNHLKLALDYLESVQVNAVYSPQTVEFLPEVFSYFFDLGVSNIHFNMEICTSWNSDVHEKIIRSYDRVAEVYIESYQNGKEIALNLVDSKIILFLKGGYSISDLCGMGNTQWAFAPSGNVYPCERFIGEDNRTELCLGNIHSGIDPIRRCEIIKRVGNKNVECKTCGYIKFCMNWCGCTNYFHTGYTEIASPTLCQSERSMIDAAKRVLAALSKEENKLFLNHFWRYFQEGRQYSKN